jgi:GntR family transcriptional regulator
LSDHHPLMELLGARLAEGSDEPIGAMITEAIWLAVVDGTLASGERLPTARQIGIRLGVSPRTVERAYDELEARGVLASRPGEGTYISLRPPSEEERERHRRFVDLCRETYEKATALGFSVEDLVNSLTEFRSVECSSSPEERKR